MNSVPRNEYIYLKDIIIRNEINQAVLSTLKSYFYKEINSNRRMSYINTIDELIKILEKRGCVSEENIDILTIIAKETKNESFFSALNPKINSEILPTKPQLYSSNTQSSIHCIDVEQKVHELIINKIGTKWIDLARELKVRESEIDKLKMQYEDNSEYCVQKVLDYHKQNVHPRNWRFLLLEALQKARRRDLKNEVEKLFCDYM